MNFISGIQATAGALNAEQVRMDIVAQNLANAHTTKDTDGNAYKRKVVSFETVMTGAGNGERGVRVSGIKPDEITQGDLVYNPGHPHANAQGMLQMPNVKLAIEMVDMMSASRAYEANLSVAKNARMMATKALAIGR
jgi:flagellar basal-body rod protein FlgC